MSNPNIASHVKVVNVIDPVSNLPTCQAVLGESATHYSLGNGQTLVKGHEIGMCGSIASGSYGGEQGQQLRSVRARINAGNGGTAGYVQTGLATTPGTAAAARSNAGVFYSP